MIGPLRHVAAVHRRTVQHVATVATVVLLAAITALGMALRTDSAPLGIVSLQLAASPDVASGMLESWAAVPRARVLWTHGLDLALPFAYALAVVSSAGRAAARSAVALSTAQIAVGAILVAAVADQVENIAMGITLVVGPNWGSVLITLVSTTVKFATLALAIGALVVTLRRAASPIGSAPSARSSSGGTSDE